MARKNVFGPSQTSDEMPDEMPEKSQPLRVWQGAGLYSV